MDTDALFAAARERVAASVDRRCNEALRRLAALARFHRRGMGQRWRHFNPHHNVQEQHDEQ